MGDKSLSDLGPDIQSLVHPALRIDCSSTLTLTRLEPRAFMRKYLGNYADQNLKKCDFYNENVHKSMH